MTLAMELRKFKEEGIAQGREKGIVQGKEEANRSFIMNLVGMNLSIDTIAKAVNQTPQYVQHVIAQAQASQTVNR